MMVSSAQKDIMRGSVYEGVRWWFAFDSLQSSAIKKNNGNATVEQIGSIASLYNFRRNLPSEPERVLQVANAVNAYSGKTFKTFDDRAAALEHSINDLRTELAKTSPKGKAVRLVSGMTKLTWFVASENWTPFDRLAATALNVKNADAVKRMRAYYRKLDEIGFADKAAAIFEISRGTPFDQVSGERILDKFLMFHGEVEWTQTALPLANAFPDALPLPWRKELLAFADEIASHPACSLDLGTKS